jgi:hypothetical protein
MDIADKNVLEQTTSLKRKAVEHETETNEKLVKLNETASSKPDIASSSTINSQPAVKKVKRTKKEKQQLNKIYNYQKVFVKCK